MDDINKKEESQKIRTVKQGAKMNKIAKKEKSTKREIN